MKELLQTCSEAAGCEKTVAEAVINQFLSEIVQELSEGHTVDLGPDFGVSARSSEPGRFRTALPELQGTPITRLFFGRTKEWPDG